MLLLFSYWFVFNMLKWGSIHACLIFPWDIALIKLINVRYWQKAECYTVVNFPISRSCWSCYPLLHVLYGYCSQLIIHQAHQLWASMKRKMVGRENSLVGKSRGASSDKLWTEGTTFESKGSRGRSPFGRCWLAEKKFGRFFGAEKRRNCHFWPNFELAEKLRDSIRQNSASPHNLSNPNL